MLNVFKVNNKDDVVDVGRHKMRKIILILNVTAIVFKISYIIIT